MPPRPWLSLFACPSHRRTVPDRYNYDMSAAHTAQYEHRLTNLLTHVCSLCLSTDKVADHVLPAQK